MDTDKKHFLNDIKTYEKSSIYLVYINKNKGLKNMKMEFIFDKDKLK